MVFVKFGLEGFWKSKLPQAYAQVWFAPVEDFVYLVKDEIDKSLFPYKDKTIYSQQDMQFCLEMLENVPQEVARQKIREIDFLMKLFEGNVGTHHFQDPDPTQTHTPDSRYWKRLNEYSHSVVKEPRFIQAITMLRSKKYGIIQHPETSQLVFQKPQHVSEDEVLATNRLYFYPFFEQFKEALHAIRDVGQKVARGKL